jgi:uncharacterized protein YkwD
MLRSGLLVMLVAALALSLGAGASASPSGKRTLSSSTTLTRATSLEELVLSEINTLRAAHGRQPLSPSAALSRAADRHSRSMALLGFFAHESRNGTPFWQRVKQYYFTNSATWAVGENLAMFGGITPNAQSIVTAWMGSPGHRANLLRSSYRDAGISIVHHPPAGGVFGGRSTWVVTLDFGRR